MAGYQVPDCFSTLYRVDAIEGIRLLTVRINTRGRFSTLYRVDAIEGNPGA